MENTTGAFVSKHQHAEQNAGGFIIIPTLLVNRAICNHFQLQPNLLVHLTRL